MEHKGVIIEDEFAEAFRMWACRLIVTAADQRWLNAAIAEVTGYGSSVIACDAEAGLERRLDPIDTPDGRPGAAILFFAFNAKALAKAMPGRVGQCLMTCPTTAVFDGLPEVQRGEDSERLDLGKLIRYFGDGFQQSKVLAGRRFWRIPVMDGEFLVEHSIGAIKAIGGGNILIEGVDQASALAAAGRAADAVAPLPDVITPFPGGVVRSGSKVGSRYKALFASSNDAFAPTVRTRTASRLRPGVAAVYEIVINGLSQHAIAHAMAVAIDAACAPGVVAISAGNYGGSLGKFHFRLHEVCNQPAPPAPAVAIHVTHGYRLVWRDHSIPRVCPLDGRALRPDLLGAMERAALAELTLRLGREQVQLGDLVCIEGSRGQRLTLAGFPPLDLLGAGMKQGELVIEGDAGDDLGASMAGGLIRVTGRAGDRIGGPAPGAPRGMTGGEIAISGDVGDHAGFMMRRGLITVGGAAGASPGFRMLAGTVVIGCGDLDHPGLEMQRGTIVCLDPDAMLTVGLNFRAVGQFAPVILRLIERRLVKIGALDRPLDSTWRLWSGDHLQLGRGELWQRTGPI